MEIQSEQLKQLGFERVFSLLLNSSEFGLAQSRARSWSLFVRSTNVRQDTLFINILSQLIKDFWLWSVISFCLEPVRLTPVRLSSSGELLMRTLSMPALPLHLFLNQADELCLLTSSWPILSKKTLRILHSTLHWGCSNFIEHITHIANQKDISDFDSQNERKREIGSKR